MKEPEGTAPDLAASTDALGLITQGIDGTLHQLESLGLVGEADMGNGFSGLSLTGMETGNDGLTSTLKDFCDRWGWGVRSLVQEGNALAQEVGLSAGVYSEEESYLSGSLKVLVNSGMGDPYASEDDITGKSWGDVLSDNAYTQVKSADYSSESFVKAGHNIEQTWKDTAWDVSDATSPLSAAIDAAGLRDNLDDEMRDAFGPSPQERAAGRGGNG